MVGLKILFATNYSSGAKVALRMLKKFRKVCKLDISLVFVLSSFWKNWLTSGRYLKEALNRLQAWQKDLGKREAKKLYIEQGNPADTIIRVANEIKAEVIVLGSKKNILNTVRYKTSTTVEAVVRAAKQSVWVCKQEKISKIICGIDGSSFSVKTLGWALEFCQYFNAKLYVVSVLPSMDFNPLAMNEKEIQEYEEKFEKKYIGKINKFLEKFDFSGIKVQKYFPWGSPATSILDMAEDFDCDLIVVGAKGHSKLKYVLIGSTAEKILRYAPCSLFVAR